MQRIILTSLLVAMVAGCASQPDRIRSNTIGEAADKARSEREEDRQVDSTPNYGHWFDDRPSSSSGSFWFGASGRGGANSNMDDVDFSEARIRIWAGRRLPEVGEQSRYATQWGYELGASALFDEAEFSGTLLYSDVSFDARNADRLHDPGLIGWELNVGGRWPLYQHLALHAGAGIGSGWLFWRYTNPLQDGHERISEDSLGYFSLQTPISLQSHFGTVMTEFVALPTLRFGQEYSDEGFKNDITHLYWGVPFAIRLGVVF